MTKPVDPTVVRDVVVVVPGIMGSTLVRPDGKYVWSLRPGTLVKAIATLGGSMRSLTLPPGINDGPATDGITAGELLPGLHVIPGMWSPVAGYAGLLTFLRSGRFHLIEPDATRPGLIGNLITFPYDWRLSNQHNARLLAARATDALELWRSQPGMQDAKLILICHSMGGLIARWFLECEGGAPLTRHLITIGTPHRGALNSLDTLSNGIEPGVGPLRARLTGLVRSMPSMYELLPTYNCLEQPSGERIGLGGVGAPELDSAMLANAVDFHDRLAAVPADTSYQFHKMVGIRQPTLTTAKVRDGVLRVSGAIDGKEQGGDGTVPRLSAEPAAGRSTEVHEIAEQHGELQGTRAALDLIDGILSRRDIIWQADDLDTIGVSMREVWNPTESPTLVVRELADRLLLVTVVDEFGNQCGPPVEVMPDGVAHLDALPPGGYRAQVASPRPGGPSPVTRPFLVWDPTLEIDDGQAGDGQAADGRALDREPGTPAT